MATITLFIDWDKKETVTAKEIEKEVKKKIKEAISDSVEFEGKRVWKKSNLFHEQRRKERSL